MEEKKKQRHKNTEKYRYFTQIMTLEYFVRFFLPGYIITSGDNS